MLRLEDDKIYTKNQTFPTSVFISLGVGSFVVSRAAGRLDVLTRGITQTVTGVGVIGGLLAVDLVARRIDWADGGTWRWVVAFALIGLIGVLLLGLSRRFMAN